MELLFLHYNNCNNCGYSVTIQSMMLRLYNTNFSFFVVLKVLFFSCLTVTHEQADYGTEGVWYVDMKSARIAVILNITSENM